ncbi:hypothetical protein [Bacillus sp. BPN334]|uniref:hypothetical protein n=1 Tax=Bacillus sp. BPN334 TaxID=2217815 RepID=UPI0011EC2F03|nr:hypothetical protein [Bacillus sp. BPN334]KAA0781299.1 hypothetical protein DN393_30265 [Bacillus sp. BPN334]
MYLSPKDILMRRIVENDIRIEESFKQAVLCVEHGGVTKYSFNKRVENGKEIACGGVVTIPQFCEENDTVQAIDLAWALAGYEMFVNPGRKNKLIIEFFGRNSYLYQKSQWRKTEEICIREGFMNSELQPYRKEKFEVDCSKEKEIFAQEFERRRNLLLQKRKDHSLNEFMSSLGIIKQLVRSYFILLFLLLFGALLDKNGMSVPLFEGLGEMTFLQIVAMTNMPYSLYLILLCVLHITKRAWGNEKL